MKYAVFILMIFALGCVSLSLAIDGLKAYDFSSPVSANTSDSFSGPEAAPPQGSRITPAVQGTQTAQPGTFQGPKGDPYIIGPSADPPNY